MKTIFRQVRLFPVLTFLFVCCPRGWSADDAGAAVRYEEADADHDGRVSRKEFLASVNNKKNWWPLGQKKANTGQNSATPEMFDALDVNRDGYLSKDEIENGRRLRENRGDNGAGASATRNNRPQNPEHDKNGSAAKAVETK
jgi:hypothetical protein